MKNLMLALFFSIFFSTFFSVGLFVHAQERFGVGQRDFILIDKARARKITTHVWYPVAPTEKLGVTGKQGPFLPVLSALNANLSENPKSFPLVLLSHGSGGTAAKLFWLTEFLVKNGMIVVGVDHPGNMTMDNSADGIMKPWLRAMDLSFALDEISKNQIFKYRIDSERVYATGHSAGGTTVLLLGGAQFSYARFENPIPNCGDSKDPYALKFCKQIKAMNVKASGKTIIERNYSDKRVKAVVALDPGFARSFNPESFKNLQTKVLVIAAERLTAPEDEIHSGDFKKLLPKSSFEILPDSIHMTFLQPCKPDIGNGDPELAFLCIDNEKKKDLQKKTAERVLRFFKS